MKVFIGEAIKAKRIAVNLTSEQLAIACKISRSTLFAIESGTGNYSIDALLKVLDVLSIDIKLKGCVKPNISKARATRINTKLDKKINRFVIMSIEQYCTLKGKTSEQLYPFLEEKGIVGELEEEYDFLHTLSSELVMEYIDALMENEFL